MRLVFCGTPEFAVPALEALVEAKHAITAAITQPDREKGRGREVAAPPVKQAAGRLGIPVYQPEKIRTPEFLDFLKGLAPEAIVVVGYGKIIPQTIIDIPPRGVLNVHASLLPKYRGAAPVQWAIANGETRTGVTIMFIDAGLDTGDIAAAAEVEIGPVETAPELAARLAPLGAQLLVTTLRDIETGTVRRVPQDHARASLAPILKKEDGLIDWMQPAGAIHNRIRGFQPWPGAYTHFRRRQLIIWRARPVEPPETAAGAPGSLHRERHRLLAACGSRTWLELLELQLEGKKRIGAAAFLNGHRVEENELLEMSL